jgi:hypothetical protein
MDIEQALLWNSLCNMGNIVKLKLHFNGDSVLQKLEPFKDNWCPYNVKKDRVNNRWGLPLTSHTGDLTDNYHLNSFGYMQKYHDTDMHEENFNTPTEVYNSLPEISNIVEQFRPDIGRVHFLRVDQGGFFPPHRDNGALVSVPSFRIIVPIYNFGVNDMKWIHDEKITLNITFICFFSSVSGSRSQIIDS